MFRLEFFRIFGKSILCIFYNKEYVNLVLSNSINARDEFRYTFTQLARKIIRLTS